METQNAGMETDRRSGQAAVELTHALIGEQDTENYIGVKWFSLLRLLFDFDATSVVNCQHVARH